MVILKKCSPPTVVFALLLVLMLEGRAFAADIVLLDFGAATCGPCQEMRPVVQRLAAAGYRVRYVDIVREPALAAQFKVDQVPTFIALFDGQEHARMVGTGTYEQLQQILAPRTEVQRGQSPDPVTANSSGQDPSVIANGAPMSTYAAPSTPQAGRIVELEDPNRGQSQSAGPVNPFGNPAPVAATSSASHARLLEATVKLSVEDAQGASAGTGTIVDARSGAVLVLTCGHLFRESKGQGPITVTFFQATPAGAQVRETAAGRLMHYDLERDLALVIVNPTSAIEAVPVAPLNTPIVPGGAVTSVGCNGGTNPTALDSQVTTIDRYQGAPNVEVAGAPVEGRSGGGLFNQAGQLIGVCFAADPQSNEGLYASLSSIQTKLDSLKLAMVYQTPSTHTEPSVESAEQATASVPAAVTAAPQDFAVRGQDYVADPIVSEPTASLAIAGVDSNSVPSLSSSEQATLEEIQRRGLDSEVICIIRAHDPSGKSEVITLNNVSPAFVKSLAKPDLGVAIPTMHSSATAAAGRLLH